VAAEAGEETHAMSSILVEKQGAVTTIVMNRPQARNALDREASLQLAAAIRAFEADPAARVAVLTGAQGNFCAGADLKELASGVDWGHYLGWGRVPSLPRDEPRVRDAMTELFEWHARGRLRPRIRSRHRLDGFRTALAALASREAIGRVVLTPMHDAA